jgi:PHD/YefM family antitoxin component YafN of YafNO toxin-antitoxin module
MATTRMPASVARGAFAETIDRVQHGRERLILRRHHKDAVAIVTIEDLRLLEAIEDKIDRKAIREARAETGSVSWEQLKAELGL